MAQEFKKYDSQDEHTIHNARLAKDAEVWEGDKGKLVTFTFVSTSRSEKSIDLWVDVKVGGFQAELASFLKKDDVLGIKGEPSMEAWENKEGNERESFTLFNCTIYPPIALFHDLKERGFTPGAAGKSAPNGKKNGGKKPAAGGKKPAQRPARQIRSSTASRRIRPRPGRAWRNPTRRHHPASAPARCCASSPPTLSISASITAAPKAMPRSCPTRRGTG